MRDFNAWADTLPKSFISKKNAQRAFDAISGHDDDAGAHLIFERSDGRFSNVVLNGDSEFAVHFAQNGVGVFGVAFNKTVGFTGHRQFPSSFVDN